MQIALDSFGNRITAAGAKRTEKYKCPLCGGEAILRQGNLNIEHFAHKQNECTDSWHYDMSEWHYGMQARFPEEQREIIVRHNQEIHRADILNKNQVIEFQHSPISIDEIEKRNQFYKDAGYNVVWVFDVQEQYDAGSIQAVDRNDDVLMYKWNHPKKCLQCFPRPTEYEEEIMIYLYWLDEYGEENFNRIIWSSNEFNVPDFKRFIVSENIICTEDVSDELSTDIFFETKEDIKRGFLAGLNCRYNIKRSGVRGYKRDDYMCPKTNTFGLKQSGEKHVHIANIAHV